MEIIFGNAMNVVKILRQITHLFDSPTLVAAPHLRCPDNQLECHDIQHLHLADPLISTSLYESKTEINSRFHCCKSSIFPLTQWHSSAYMNPVLFLWLRCKTWPPNFRIFFLQKERQFCVGIWNIVHWYLKRFCSRFAQCFHFYHCFSFYLNIYWFKKVDLKIVFVWPIIGCTKSIRFQRYEFFFQFNIRFL